MNKIAENSIYARKPNSIALEYCGQLFLKHMIPGNVLELGPAEGLMTDLLYPKYSHDYTIVDGSSIFVNQIQSRYPKIKAYTSLFEDFLPDQKYSNIILGHVLEHVVDPAGILEHCKNWLNKGGVILAAVPNANSLHRQAAVEMGLLGKLDDFSDKDRRHGHRRVFTRPLFSECFEKAGLAIKHSGGYWIKPLSDGQIEKDWTDDMINAFMILGEDYPEIAAEIYVIATAL